MSKSLNINAPQIVQTRNTLNAVPSGSTATPDENVKYVPQDLTEAQKAQARQNIGAAEEGGGGQQVQANWNETDTTSPAYIQNKPTIPAAPVQSNWNESDTTSLAYIQNKPNIPNFPAVTNPIMMDNWTSKWLFTRKNSASLSAKYDWFWSGNSYQTSSDPTSRESIDIQYASLGVLHLSGGTYEAIDLNIYNDNDVWCWASENQYGLGYYNQVNFNSTGTFNLVYEGAPDYVACFNSSNSNHPEQCWVWLMNNDLRGESYDALGNLVLADASMATLQIYIDTSSISSLIGIDIYVPKSRLTEFETRMKAVYGTANYESYIEPKVHTYDFITQNGLQLKMITLPTIPLTMTDALGTVIDGDFVAQNVTITPAV